MEEATVRSASSSDHAESAPLDVWSRLARFDGPPGEFLRELLALQCGLVGAPGAAIVAPDTQRHMRALVVHPRLPEDKPPPAWLARSAEAAPGVLASGESLVRAGRRAEHSGNGHGAETSLICIPVGGVNGTRAVAAYAMDDDDPLVLARARERLELTVAFIAIYESRRSDETRRADVDRLRRAMEVLDAVNEEGRLRAAAMAFCNELAGQWGAERVTLGFLEGRYVQVAAISHTDRFDRRMQLVQSLAAAMEECLDQDVEVFHPVDPEATFVSRSAAALCLRHGPTSVLSLPLRRNGEPHAVVCLERPPDRLLSADEVETIRLTCDLAAARLLDLHANDRWIGAKVAASARAGLSGLLGPRHTWAKVTALAVLAFLLFALLVKGDDRVQAAFEIQAIEQRIVPAPFAGRLEAVFVEPGDLVRAGQSTLAKLETAELQLELAAVRAERAAHLKEADLALRERNAVEVQIAEARLGRVEARIRLLEHQIAEATIIAPIDGTVVSGDLKRAIGGPLEIGRTLFEIAPLEGLRAELEVPEDRIADVLGAESARPGRSGRLASVAHPGDSVQFVLERITPIAEVVDGDNVFKVRVRLLEVRPWMRPGMTGVAKVTVGRRSYASIWTRPLVEWVRMKLWI